MRPEKSGERDWMHDLERRMFSILEKDGKSDERKTMDEVFSMRTLSLLSKLISNGILDTVDFPISTGKEGNVFKATSPDGENLAVKIYRTSNANFNAITNYIMGDPRFQGLSNNRRRIISTWCLKEYKNLLRLKSAGVNVPEPRKALENILVMEYIGDERSPAPPLKRMHPSVIEDPQDVFNKVISDMRKAYVEANFVHADMSEYNVLLWDQKPWIIDVAQGVLSEHPLAEQWLVRDVFNICSFFKKIGVKSDPKAILTNVRGG